MEHLVIPTITAIIGFVAGNWKDLLSYRNKSSRDELSLYNELQAAVKSAREDTLELYKIIDLMEAKNISLMTENQSLRIERDTFKEIADTARKKLDETLEYLSQVERKLKDNFGPDRDKAAA